MQLLVVVVVPKLAIVIVIIAIKWHSVDITEGLLVTLEQRKFI